MSLTVHQLGKSLIRRLGALSFDPAVSATNQERRGLVSGDTDEALIAINGAMEECFSLGPIELSEQQQAGVLRAATGITLDVTQYSQTIANLATWASWMQGCTVRIAGDTRDNELITQTQLLRPFMGPTTSAAVATVYGDAIPLASTVSQILGPVEIPEQCALCPVIGQPSWHAAIGGGYPGGGQSKPIGQPSHWTVETRNLAANAFTQRILRVSTLPDKPYSLTWRAKVKPPVYALSDFYAGTSYDVDPNTIIPFDWAESTLLPLALLRFSAHPAFDPAQLQSVVSQAETAKRIFTESAKPQSSPQKAYYAWRV